MNTVVREGDRLVGHNTDGIGLELGFPARAAEGGSDAGRAPRRGRRRLGVRRCSVSPRRAAQLVIVDREAARAAALAARLNQHLPGARASASTDLGAAL